MSSDNSLDNVIDGKPKKKKLCYDAWVTKVVFDKEDADNEDNENNEEEEENREDDNKEDDKKEDDKKEDGI